jgi:hypothetical protein
MRAPFEVRRYIRAAMLVAACLATGLVTSGCGVVKEGEAYIWGMESWSTVIPWS